MNLTNFFRAKRVAVIGASREEGKIGNVVFKNFLEPTFKGEVFPVNPKAIEILGYACYKSVRKIPGRVDLAVIAVPAAYVPGVLKDCYKKGIKDVVLITAGFKEVGNVRLERKLQDALKKYGIRCLGPNCLGVLDTTSGIDTWFLPSDRLKRPKKGVISFISQSGATGSATLDLASEEGYGFAKCISYGNAANIDESDIIEYLGSDPETKVICAYIEGVHDGKKFLQVAKKVSAKKPIIIIKGGLTEAGGKATLSHTGSLAGTAQVYLGAFKQAGLVIANRLEEVFDYMKVFEKVTVKPKGRRIQVITNGGGYGILCVDEIELNNLQLAEMSKATERELKKKLPPIAAVHNPIDVLGDATAERYKLALDACIKDPNIDIIIVVALSQVPLLNLDEMKELLSKKVKESNKPIVAVTTGSTSTELFKKALEAEGVAVFTFPANAVKALKQYVEYYKK